MPTLNDSLSDFSFRINSDRIYGPILETPDGGGTDDVCLRGMLRGKPELNQANRVRGERVSDTVEAHWP